MAKRINEQTPQRPNSSLRVLYVELNGADTTIEEALRTVDRMRRPAVEAPQPTKRITNTPRSTNGEAAPAQPTLFDDPDSNQPDPATLDSQSESGAEVEPPPETSRRKRGEGDPKDRNAGITPVGDIDFVPNGKPALKTFFAEKAPGSDMDQILVLCHYIQQTLNYPKFGPSHILTGFKHVGKPVPKDLKATIRNMKKRAWLNFTDMESIRLTTEGENRVEHELGKGKSDAGAQ